MKKYLLIGICLVCALGLVSWGVVGHKAIGLIAEKHLSPKAKLAVKKLLGNESLADVSNYADEIRSNPQYKYTSPWHFINLPSGLNYQQFESAVNAQSEDNVYKSVLQFERDLKDPLKSRKEKAVALKFLVHFIGDMHQPMHVSHAEDRGGNTVRVMFDGRDDNLHGVWDGALLMHNGDTYKEIAAKFDTASTVEIKKWQSDDIMVWMWESYQISSILYKEAAQNWHFDEAYYNSHLPVLQKRIDKAGIRLAGVLNGIFEVEK